ncbi:MAG: thioredoxin domain-containing protein, partial [Cyanobacteria bacterium J06648_11]
PLRVVHVQHDKVDAIGKPTLLEFYADWCSTCKLMAPTMAELEDEFSDRVNFVMLNVDNPKWMPELTQYGVNGIPHFAFLDANARRLAIAIGDQPREVMTQNLIALRDGASPIAGKTGSTSSFQAPTASSTQPRDHGIPTAS